MRLFNLFWQEIAHVDNYGSLSDCFHTIEAAAISQKINGMCALENREKKMKALFKAKQKRRQELARLPIEEKVKILVQLQRIAATLFLKRGLRKTPWKL